jgi:OOP family OmpA-OmpF porin
MKDMYAQTVMTELAAERKILIENNATLPDMNWMAGIFSFTPGSGFDNLTSYYPMQPYDKKTFSRAVANMPREPKGATLLQQGLSELDKVLAGLSGRTVIFLFTDGQYTPVGSLMSPPALARSLAAKYDICFVVINTGAEKKGFKDIKAIASVNDCSYMVPFEKLLGNPEWMTSSLFSVVDKKPDSSTETMVGYEWQNILFDFDKSDIKQEYVEILAKVGAFMKEHPKARVVLAGHTDNIGTWDYNIKLSHRRAASVRQYLVDKEGIDVTRITLSGFGYEDPVATNKTAEGRALNRRVQGVITGIE